MSTKACPRPDGPPCTLGLPWSLSAIDCVLLKVSKVRLAVAGALRVRPLRRLSLSRLQGRLCPRNLQVGWPILIRICQFVISVLSVFI